MIKHFPFKLIKEMRSVNKFVFYEQIQAVKTGYSVIFLVKLTPNCNRPTRRVKSCFHSLDEFIKKFIT